MAPDVAPDVPRDVLDVPGDLPADHASRKGPNGSSPRSGHLDVMISARPTGPDGHSCRPGPRRVSDVPPSGRAGLATKPRNGDGECALPAGAESLRCREDVEELRPDRPHAGLRGDRRARLNVSLRPRSASHFLHRPESARCWSSAASNSVSDVPNTVAVQASHVLCRSADPPGGFAGAPRSAAVSGGAIGIQSVP